ncbi:MAG: hypothetical protein HOQ45_05715, partial [Nocardioidaceae bacterium]|nr:hypothetical protein [Nocardioidaceae bacterium]
MPLPVSSVHRALRDLDPGSAALVRPALEWMRLRGDDPAVVRAYLDDELPRRTAAEGRTREAHEVAWALADLFERAGLPVQAALCRDPATHERLAVRHWAASFGAVPEEFWQPALAGLHRLPQVPERVRLSLVSATGLLEEVGEGVDLTPEGLLPPPTVRALDDRYRWTEEFPWMQAVGEQDVPPLSFLHRHLVAQRLLAREGDRLVP